MKRLALPLALAAVFGIARQVSAHPVPFSYLDLRVEARAIDVTFVAHVFDLAHDLGVDPPERLLTPSGANERAAAIVALLQPRLQIEAGGRTLVPEWSAPDVLVERQSLKFHLHYALIASPGAISISALMFPYDPNHQTFLNIYERGALALQAMLDRGRQRFEYFPGTRQGTLAVVQKFVPAGIHHILIGPDHLLFLVGLLLLGGSVRQLLVVVTAFTLAHSLTLSLAALDIVSPPARIIEPAIALSIVYVGADNLLVRNGRDVRAWIALTFGFIHGFGFANVLREMDLPGRALGWSLFSFNLGVEIGQLAVVIAVASALSLLRSRSEAAGRQLAFAGSLVVMAAGAFWFVQRVFFTVGNSARL
jgi:hydrogenase/urease accessory protein HupE